MKVSGSNLSASKTRTRFGMFAGVFTPSVLTILGIILFLRTGYVVGLVGTAQAFAIILMAYVISILTSLSLAVIATQMQIKGGGFYYIISRTLGIEFGVALGVTLFLSISIGIAFYAAGLGEIVAQIAGVGEDSVWSRWIAASVIAVLFIFAWVGADWATKLQYVVMACVAASLVAFFAGAYVRFDTALFTQNWSSSDSSTEQFWFAFALFFPAITGFTQGLNMSGDLTNPKRAIPLGTFLAVGASLVIYVAVALLLGGLADQATLLDNYFVMADVAAIGWLISAGVIAATTSSGMASMLGAPRVLQALAQDRVFDILRPFGKGHGADENPRQAVILTAAIALGAVTLGDLNFLAPIITMFFLASYGLLNYATYFVSTAGSPSFRPTFKYFHKFGSLAGALACVGAMLAINPLASFLAGFTIFAIYQYVKHSAVEPQWADSKRAYRFQLVRDLLFEIDGMKEHARDWRPLILVFVKDDETRDHLVSFASCINADSGITSVIHILEGKRPADEDRQPFLAQIRESIKGTGSRAFPLIVGAPDFELGVHMLLQSYGIGPLKPNTILVNWVNSAAWHKALYSAGVRFGYNMILWAGDKAAMAACADPESGHKRIDIWWHGNETSRLALLMGYLMTRTEAWDQAELRVLAHSHNKKPQRTNADLAAYLDEVHIDATVEMLEKITLETITEVSSRSTLVFFPIQVTDGKPENVFKIDLDEFVVRVPNTAFLIAASDFNLDPNPDSDSGPDTDKDVNEDNHAGKDDKPKTKKS